MYGTLSLFKFWPFGQPMQKYTSCLSGFTFMQFLVPSCPDNQCLMAWACSLYKAKQKKKKRRFKEGNRLYHATAWVARCKVLLDNAGCVMWFCKIWECKR